MKLILSCLAVLFLASVSSKPRRNKVNVVRAFDEAGITDLLDIAPPENLLEVKYGSIRVNLGNEIYPGLTTQLPTIAWRGADPDAFYTWMMLDPNANGETSEEQTPNIAVYCIIVNIQNNDLEAGDELAKFINANPRPGTGVHDYVYLYYRQKEEIDTSSCDLPAYEDSRRYFNLTEFLEEIEFCEESLEAGNYHSAQFPDNLKKTCEEEDFCN